MFNAVHGAQIRKLLSLQRLVTFLCLVAFLATTVAPGGATVLCIGPYGHLAVEPTHEGILCPSLSHLLQWAQPGAELNEAPGCTDFPLTSQLRDDSLSGLAKWFSAYWALVWTFLSPDLTLGRKVARFYSAFPPGVSDPGLIRSVVRLI
jgi:hypothetical protein